MHCIIVWYAHARFDDRKLILTLKTFIRHLVLVFFCCPQYVYQLQRCCSHAAYLNTPVPSHIQGQFCIVALRRLQIIGRPPSAEDTALLLSHFSGVWWWCLFNIHRTPPPTDENVSWVLEPDWMSVPSREQTATTYQSPSVDSVMLKSCRVLQTQKLRTPPPHTHTPWWEPRAIKGSFFLSL